MEEENVNLQSPQAPTQQPEPKMPARNESFFNDVYSDFFDRGYQGDKNDFMQLLCSNDEACTDAYELAVAGGYRGTVEQFKSHIGVNESVSTQKKNQVETGFGPTQKEDTVFNYGYEPGVDPNEIAKQHKQEKLDKAWEEFSGYVEKKAQEENRELEEPKDQGELLPITETEEAYRISAGDAKARQERKERLQRVAEGKEEINTADSLFTSMGNLANQLVSTVPYADWLMGVFMKEVGDLDLKDEIKQLTDIDTDAYFAEADAKIQKMKSYVGPTLGFTDMTSLNMPVMTPGGLQFVDIPEVTLDNSGKFIAGAFNAMTSFAASAIQSRLTGGVGLATDMIARSIESYNQSKAEDLGITTQELYKTKQQEILPGLMVGVLSHGLEKLGMDEVLGGVMSKGAGVVNKFVQAAIASGAEGGTEYFQAILEKMNELVAKRDPGDVGKMLGEYMTSKPAIEALLQGMVGGAGAKTLALGYETISAVKTDEQKQRQEELIKEVASIEDQLTKPSLSVEEKIVLKETRNGYVEELRDINKAVDEIAKNIPQEFAERIKTLYEKQVEMNSYIPKILNSTNLTEEQKNQAIEGLQKRFNEYQQQINDIVTSFGKERVVNTKANEFVLEKGEVQETVQAPYIADGVDLTDNNKLQEYKESLDPTLDSDKIELVQSVENVKNALGNIAPEMGVVVHGTNESFEQAIPEAKEVEGGARGAFDSNGILHINLTKADKTTAAHEAFHVLLKKAFGIDASKYKGSLESMLNAIKSDIAGTELEAEIEAFVEQYDESIQNEEKLSELFGKIAATETKFKASTRQKIKQWVNNTARSLGMKDLFTDKDIQELNIKNLLNTLSGKVSQGKKITKAEVLSLNVDNLEKVSRGEDIEAGQELGSIVISAQNDKPTGRKIDLQLVSRLGVDVNNIKRGTLSDLDGARAFVFAADQAVTGRIMSPTGVEHDFMGGFLYPYLNQGAWAFTDEANARKVLNKAKETDGVGLVMSQASSGILGSNSFQEYAIKEVYNSVNNGADSKFIVDRINEVLESSYKKGTSYSDYLQSKGLPGRVNNINDLSKLFPYSGKKATNYESRNGFYSKLFNAGMEKETGIPRFDFGKGVKNRNSRHGITMSEYVNDPALSKVEYGDIVSAIQFDKNSDIIDSRKTTSVKTHPSYPFVVKGNPIMVFNEAYDVREVAPSFVPKTGNKTPLGQRGKSQAARAAMGGQPTSTLKEVTPQETITLLQRATPKKITRKQVDDALSKDKTSQKIIAKKIPVKTGDKVGVRLNLNVFKNTGVPVQTIHKGSGESYKEANGVSGFFKGEAIKYDAAVTLKDAYFNTHQKSIYEVKNNIKNKFPLASVDGLYQDIELDKQKYTGTEIRFNPKDTQLFETLDGKPVRYAEEATMIGTRVYARGKIEFFNEDNRPKPFVPSGTMLQQSRATEEQIKAFDDLYDRSAKKAAELTKPKKTLVGKIGRSLGNTFDRQRQIGNFLKGEGSKEAIRAYNVMKTSQGSNGAAAAQFDEYHEKAFKGLKAKDEDILNKIVQLRRVISINESRARRGDTAYDRVGINEKGEEVRIDGNVAQGILNSLQDNIGEGKFNELMERANAVFDGFSNNLRLLYKAGRIDEETYLRFKDTEYSPMLAIQNIVQDNEGLYEGEQFDHIMLKYGLSKQDIKSLTDQNSQEIINDVRWLLRMHTAVTQNKVFANKMLTAFNDAYENNKEAFEGLIYDNPVIGKVKVGDTRGTVDKESEPVYRLKYKHESDRDKNRPKGTSVLKFYDKGKPKFIVMNTEMARQMLDIKPENYTKAMQLIDTLKIDWILGARTLRYMATIGNPLFVLPAAPMDFSNIILNNKIYSAFLPKAAIELGIDAITIAAKKMRSDMTEFTEVLGSSSSFDQLYKEFALHGGSMDYLSREGIKDLQRRKEYGRLKNTGQKIALRLGQALSYIGQTSELTFRLAAYQKQKSNLLKEYVKAHGINPTGQALEDIMHEAALAARNTINFSEGGNTIKGIDKVAPYLNAAFQGTRKVADAFKEDRKITFVKYAQALMFAGATPAISYMILQGLAGNDEDEAKKLMKKFIEDTGTWEKTQYTLVPTGLNKDGNIEYIRIRRNPATAMVATLGNQAGLAILNKKYGLGIEFDLETTKDAFEKAMPISLNDLDARIPTISAALTYIGNEDTFFEKKIYFGPEDVLPEYEGLQNDKVNNLYKFVSQGLAGMGLSVSPIRSQAALEKIVTNPKTNLLMSMIYGVANVIPTEWGSRTQTVDEFIKTISSDVSAKVKRTTNPNIKSYEEINDRQIDLLRQKSDIYDNEQKVYTMIKRLNKNGELDKAKVLPKEVQDFIRKTFPPQMRAVYLRRYTRYMKNRDVNQKYFDIAYENNSELQAREIYKWYGPDLSGEDRSMVIRMSIKAGRKIPGRTWSIYNNLSKGKLE